MTSYDVRRLALVLAKQAEIEAMKAANRAAKYQGRQIEHLKDAFLDKGEEMKVLACVHDEQLSNYY